MVSNPYQPPQHDSDPPRRSSDRPLTGRDLFGVVVRSVGLFAILNALWSMSGLFYPTEGNALADYVVGGVPLLVIGFVFLVGANGIVRLAYGRERPPRD